MDASPRPGTCERCGYLSSQAVCKACVLLEGLNKGLPQMGVGRTRSKGRATRAGTGKVVAGVAGGGGGDGAEEAGEELV